MMSPPVPPAPSSASKPTSSFSLFGTMVKRPTAFLVFLPALWGIFIAAGWIAVDEKVEKRMREVWTQQRSSYARDQAYLEEVRGGLNAAGISTFGALAATRDGENLFTEDRLNEIRQRMMETETVTITYKDEVYTWEDVCFLNNVGLGTSYEFPCARFSPMDFFQEAQWYFAPDKYLVTWYQEVVQKQVVKPRLERFGILQGVCNTNGEGNTATRNECDHTYLLRTSPDYAEANGYPREFAKPVSLFADIGSLELNHPCKICIEDEFESTITQLETAIRGSFRVLLSELRKADAIIATQAEAVNAEPSKRISTLIAQVEAILSKLDRRAVVDYFTYSVIRDLYIELGSSSVMERWPSFMSPTSKLLCGIIMGGAEKCPATINRTQAKEIMTNHADHAFSSSNTAGFPIPYFNPPEADGSGQYLFGGTSPMGGSGVDLSGTRLSMTIYLDVANYGSDAWNPLFSSEANVPDPDTDPFWNSLVETDPVYKWFMAGETPMTSHCGNDPLPGTNTGTASFDGPAAESMADASNAWCSKFTVPFETDAEYTVQYFARMWYDLLLDSPSFLGVRKGTHDPYTWTLGQGCGYSLGGERYSYTNKTVEEILSNASGELYYIDEGASLGAIDRNLLMGGTVPPIAEYNPIDNPLQKVEVIQTFYPMLLPTNIVARVKNCNRPGGSVDITLEDAEEIQYLYKEAMEAAWTKGWDDPDDGEIQFVGFFDDSGAIGTMGRLLREITMDNGTLMAASILIILVFSALFLFSCDMVDSRVLVTTVGVALVLMAYFAAIAFALLCGIKINITIAWTLPFILLGLGVDDMYIVLEALHRRQGYTEEDFTEALTEVIVPVTMTSMTNLAMFGIMNLSDIPAVYLTAQVACIAVTFLYLSIIFCFPAWCWLDMRRQAAGQYDIFLCCKDKKERTAPSGKLWSSFVYDRFYKPLILGSRSARMVTHSLIWIATCLIFGFGIWGLTERQLGLGLEDLFPVNHQAYRWATIRTEELASWTMSMNWGALNYSDPDTQMQMIKQFEDVVATPYVAEVDTDQLWIAEFAVWTTRQCKDNFDRDDLSERVCGRDQVFDADTDSTCSGFWTPNVIDLREKMFPAATDACVPFKGGICRPTSQMHALDLEDLSISEGDTSGSFCPVFGGDWSNEKFKFCLERWRELTGGDGSMVLEASRGTPTECEGDFLQDEGIVVPIPYSASVTMYCFGLRTHDNTMEMLKETRAICDNNKDLHCFMKGIPYDYWSQYAEIFDVFWELGGTSVAAGILVSFAFLFIKVSSEPHKHHPVSRGAIVIGSLVGSILIAITTFISLISVAGLSFIAGTNLTGFSNMSFVLSVGFAVEYSTHIVARWLRADPTLTTAVERVEFTMSYLTVPTFMSFVSSTIGVSCLAFTDFEFNKVNFFQPLIIVMFVTYFIGCWWLPVLLTLLDFDQVKLGVAPNGLGARMDKQPDGDDHHEQPVSPLDESSETAEA